MKTFLLTIGFAFSGIFTSFTKAQTIPLTIDSTQSSANVSSLDGSASSSQLSGTVGFDISIPNPPSGNAQITELDLVLDEALNYTVAVTFNDALAPVLVETLPGDLTITMVTPGAPGTISQGDFSQSANLLELDGDLNVEDSTGLAGGNQTLDLSSITFDPVDFNSVTVARSGDVITISGTATLTQTIDLGSGNIPIVIELTYVASGDAPASALLGDVNLDGSVNFLDISPFIAALTGGDFQPEADINQDSSISFLDIAPFINLLSSQ